MYRIADYGAMFADTVRMEAYVKALQQTIKPGAIVLELGTGTGIFALIACQLGAKRVYAVEPNDAIQVARQIAADNGYSDRIEFIQNYSTKINLPEQADILLSDLRGILPFFDHHFSSIIDARERFLAPQGIQLPQQDTLWAAVVTAPDLYAPYVEAWEKHNYGFKMEAARRLVLNHWGKGQVQPEQVLAEPACLKTLNYLALTQDETNLAAKVVFEVKQAATAHGVLLWFDAIILPGITFSNAPGQQKTVYGSSFFPWLYPVALAIGDQVEVELKADLVGDDYLWSWQTKVWASDHVANPKANFQQSTFFGTPLSPRQLRKRADVYVPRRNETGELDQYVLAQMNGQHSQGEIARLVCQRWPQRFQTFNAALTHVTQLSAKYSE